MPFGNTKEESKKQNINYNNFIMDISRCVFITCIHDKI